MARSVLISSLAASPGTFISNQRSWLLALGIASKSCLPVRVDSGIRESFFRARRAFYERKLSPKQ